MVEQPPLRLVDLDPDAELWNVALPVLQELRASRTPEQLRESIRDGAAQGLRFLAALDGERCLGIAGWRLVVNTSAGQKLYIDDLVTTASARSRGIGMLILDELQTRARATGCSSMELDSGVQRFEAHRFYLRHRMHISAHHFALPLDFEH